MKAYINLLFKHRNKREKEREIEQEYRYNIFTYFNNCNK